MLPSGEFRLHLLACSQGCNSSLMMHARWQAARLQAKISCSVHCYVCCESRSLYAIFCARIATASMWCVALHLVWCTRAGEIYSRLHVALFRVFLRRSVVRHYYCNPLSRERGLLSPRATHACSRAKEPSLCGAIIINAPRTANGPLKVLRPLRSARAGAHLLRANSTYGSIHGV